MREGGVREMRKRGKRRVREMRKGGKGRKMRGGESDEVRCWRRERYKYK